MSVRRPALLLAAAGLAASALTGCQKPPPYASVYAGGHTASGQASSWCFGNGSAAALPLPTGCTQGPVLAGILTVTAGEQVAIDIPSTAAKDGWTAALLTATGGGNVTRVPGIARDKSYTRFTVPTGITTNTYVLEVIALRPAGTPDRPRGVWRFRLDVRNAG